MSENTSRNIILIVTAVAAMVTGVWFASYKDPLQNTSQPAQIQGVILPQAKTIRPFKLIDHHEQVFSLQQLKGHWSLLFVGYTQCPDVCPTALSVLKQVHQLMNKQSRVVPKIVFISVDPERDSPALLAKYVAYFNKEFLGVTGELDQLKNITQQLSVMYAKAPGSSGNIDGDDYLMDHSSSFMLINPQGKLQSFLSAPHTPIQIVNSITRSQTYYNDSK